MQVEEFLGCVARFTEKMPVERATPGRAVLNENFVRLAAKEPAHELGVWLVEGDEAAREVIILGKGSRGEYEGQGRTPHTPNYHIEKYECW